MLSLKIIGIIFHMTTHYACHSLPTTGDYQLTIGRLNLVKQIRRLAKISGLVRQITLAKSRERIRQHLLNSRFFASLLGERHLRECRYGTEGLCHQPKHHKFTLTETALSRLCGFGFNWPISTPGIQFNYWEIRPAAI